MLEFAPGQIWYWSDPICGPHAVNRKHPEGDGVVRFSRYVIIIQDYKPQNLDKDDNDSGEILVIPCTSKRKFDTDIPLNINTDKTSYARVSCIEPVKPSQLLRYIKQAPQEVMREIKSSLLKILGKDLVPMKRVKDIVRYTEDGSKIVSSFHVTKVTLVADDIVEDHEKSRWHSYLMKRFIRDYMSLGNNVCANKYQLSPRYAKRLYAKWKLWANDISGDIHSRNRKWTEENKITFLDRVDQDGPFKVAERYGYDVETVKGYYRVWNRSIQRFQIEESQLHESEKPVDDYDGSIEDVRLPDNYYRSLKASEVKDIIDRIARSVEHSLRSDNAYQKLNYNSKHMNISDDVHRFYSRIKECVISSLYELLGITEKNHKLTLPTINKNMRYFKTWMFLVITHDDPVFKDITGVGFFDKARWRYNGEFTIDEDWIKVVKRYFDRKLNIIPSDVDAICECLKHMCCIRSYK